MAKELAARGLDVLLLESRGRHADPGASGRISRDANHPFTGYLRFPAGRSRPAWRRELPQSSAISQSSGVGGSTQHYYANSPRAMPGAFLDYEGRTATPRYGPPVPAWLPRTCTLLRVGGVYTAGADRADGHKEGLLPWRGGSGAAGQNHKNITRHPFARRRTPSSSRAERLGRRKIRANSTSRKRRAAPGHCCQGCLSPWARRAIEGQAFDR